VNFLSRVRRLAGARQKRTPWCAASGREQNRWREKPVRLEDERRPASPGTEDAQHPGPQQLSRDGHVATYTFDSHW
jgi:hypothetical protein